MPSKKSSASSQDIPASRSYGVNEVSLQGTSAIVTSLDSALEGEPYIVRSLALRSPQKNCFSSMCAWIDLAFASI